MPPSLPFSLEALSSHAIFVPPASSSTDDGWEVVEPLPSVASDEGLPGAKNDHIAIRDKDLLVAFGREIRMTNLAGEGWEVHAGAVGGYKTLRSPHLTFPIHQLVINPTGRLLAVVGHHQLVVLVLPRSGFATNAAGGDIVCRSFPVDEYQHSPSSTNAVTKVHWHPWGEDGNSLWVLTADGKLYEYDVLHPQDPVQAFNFLSDKSSSKFSAIDPLSQYATSFSFSEGTMDFAPLMVYALMANGDIYTMGPVLPLHAEVPVEYLQSLQAFVSERSKRLQSGEDEAAGDEGSAERAALVGRVSLQSQWVESLVSQVKRPDAVEEDATSTPAKRRGGYGLGREPAPSPPRDDRPPPPPGMVRVHPPNLTASGNPAPGIHRPLMRQGPLLYSPTPEEVGNGDVIDEQMATDLVVIRAGAEAEAETEERLNVLAIAWSGGRVDLGVEVDTPEPRWVTSRDPSPGEVTLPIIESVLSSFPTGLEPEAVSANAPSFVQDVIHPDVVYVQHSFGVDAISVAPWASKLLTDSDDPLPPSDVACLVEASPSKPIVGTVTFCNIHLGYGLLALATSGQLAAVEMDFRVKDSGLEPPPQPEVVHDPSADSLLTTAFNVDAILAQIRSPAKPFDPRAAVRKLPDSDKQLTVIGPDHLRALAGAASQVRTKAEAIRSASTQVERRLDLDIRESNRQLKELHSAVSGIDTLRTRAAANAERAEAMAAQQAVLSRRLDAILSAMLSEYRPQIGVVERKWFDELERLRVRVAGSAGRRPTQGLAHRAQVLKEQLAVVRPLAEKAAREEQEAGEGAYGSKQLRPLEMALSQRSDELARMMRRMEALTVKVEDSE